MLPRLAPLDSQDEVDDLQSSWLLWLNGILTPIIVAAIALSPPFFRLWIGSTLGSAASPVAAILLVGCWLHGIGHIASTVVIGRSRPDLLTKLLLGFLIPYLVLLYVLTALYGVMGAAAAWSIRAACDPVLFAFTRPRREDLWTVACSAVLVFVALMVGLALPWAALPYWGCMGVLAAAACYQNRLVLISTMANLKTAVFN
jgi:O-antigen/teichoic acid export membrane protein